MTKIDFIIVGQGICGSMLSYDLIKSGKSVLVIDNNIEFSASKVASGVINPVTGRRAVITWLAEEILPFCKKKYEELEREYNIPIISQKNILAFHSNQQMVEVYQSRLEEEHPYLKNHLITDRLRNQFNFLNSVTEIEPIYLIEIKNLLNAVQKLLTEQQSFLQENFNEEELIVTNDEIIYKNFSAEKIIYCNGIDCMDSKYWNKLPFVKNKGQALIVEIEDVNDSKIYKFGSTTFVPWYKNTWWVGSTYELNFDTHLPTQNFYNNTNHFLKNILKVKYNIVDHIASIRPAAVERRPFVGFHPKHKNVGILNGMGTKGCSLAPYFSNQLVHHILNNNFIHPEADVHRFTKILSS